MSFLSVANGDEHLARVVLLDLLALARRHPEAQTPRPRLVHRDVDPDAGRLVVRRKLDVLCVDDAPLVFHHQPHPLPGQAPLSQAHFGDERRADQHGARGFDPTDLDVGGEALPTDTHRGHGGTAAAQREQRLCERAAGRIGAIADQNDAGDGQLVELLSDAIENRCEVGLVTVKRQLPDIVEPLSFARSPKQAQLEPRLKLLDERRSASERLLEPVAAARSVDVGDLHARGIVQDQRHEALLRHHRVEHEHGLAQAEDDQSEDRDPQRSQRDALPARGSPTGLRRAQQRQRQHRRDDQQQAERDPAGLESELSASEGGGPVLEEEGEGGF